jgi:hypothetical protein
MARVPASEQTRKRIAEVLRGDFDKSALLRNAVRLIIEEALEAEVTDALGRDYYERGEPVGYRNGNRLGRLKTAEGIVDYAVPQVTGTAEPWASEVRRALSGRPRNWSGWWWKCTHGACRRATSRRPSPVPTDGAC